MNAQAIVAAALFGGALAGEYAIAEFGESGSGLMGYVKVANGHVMVDLNFSMVNYEALGLAADCNAGGLSWHMHTMWDSDVPDGFAGACGAGDTDWHFDPWLACGSATGNRDCVSRWGGCVASSYDCSASTYMSNPLNCEVGDWSGQFGKIPETNDSFAASYFSYWSPLQEDLTPGMMNYSTSVVLHCNGGARAFCAGFQYRTDSMSYDQPATSSSNVFDFKALFEGFMVQTDNAGYTVFAPEELYSNADACDMWDMKFHTEWNSESHALMSECAAATGPIADPTNQCINDGSSMYCMYDTNTTEWMRCNDTGIAFSYDCDGYECAIGDASGRVGNVDLAMCTGENLYTDENNDIFCMLRLWDDVAIPQAIVGSTVKSVSLRCVSDSSMVACAKTGVDNNVYDDDDADDDDAASSVVAVFATVFAALVASMQ